MKVEKKSDLNKKILSLSKLEKTLLSLPKGKTRPKIVFTNGCFDLLHPGHVQYLQEARRLGTHLVVALNTDRSVKKLKGPSRPLNTLVDRAQVVAALESVSFVTWFDENTPILAILKLKPDFLVKGGDWKPSQIVGSKEIKAWGGKTKSIRYRPGKSTTAIIQKMTKN